MLSLCDLLDVHTAAAAAAAKALLNRSVQNTSLQTIDFATPRQDTLPHVIVRDTVSIIDADDQESSFLSWIRMSASQQHAQVNLWASQVS